MSSSNTQEDDLAKNLLSNLESLLAGGVGGICAVLIGHPFDLIKVRLQTAASGVYTNMADCVKKTVARDGLLGLYRGVLPPLVGVTPMYAISFWGYDLGKRIVSSFSSSQTSALSTQQICTAGAISAIPTTFVAAPFERIKVLLQVDGQSSRRQMYSGPLDVILKLYREGGMMSLFRGSFATFARDGPGSAVYFGTYEVVKQFLSPKMADGSIEPLSVPSVIFAGGLAGLAMWTLVYPIDTIKSQLQSNSTNDSFVSIARKIKNNYGIKGFFPGLGPALLRAFPANAAAFLGVELTHRMFSFL